MRRHWPFPTPGPHPSLPWSAAKQAGANLSALPRARWLRYYGEKGPWTSLSYEFAMAQATNYFRDKIVFIGSQPKTTLPDGEVDEFRTPYSRWTGKSAGGVEILATSFLNLLNDDWLHRSSWWAELLLLLMAGLLVGGGLCLVRGWLACVLGLGAALFAMIAAVLWSFYGSTWFPWLLVTGGQVPCALAWAVTSRWRAEGIVSSYEVAKKPFGKGAYGEVFLAQHKKSREWFAFKKVYLAKFNDPAPYEREFRGITRYVPVSSQHPGLLRVHYVGRDEREGHFFYVMDLGDAQSSGWEKNLASYQPCDLAAVCERAERQRLPVHECVRIGLVLSAALDFLHRQGLIHRDIKPSNIIFVKGQPKFADVGLVAEISRPGQESSWVGTEAYMPPLPEPPGTPAADIYALGVVLYVISAGRKASSFPELSETLLKEADQGEFMRLNKVILKACLPHVGQRYASAAEMHAALQSVRNALDPNPTEEMTQRSAQPSPPTA